MYVYRVNSKQKAHIKRNGKKVNPSVAIIKPEDDFAYISNPKNAKNSQLALFFLLGDDTNE
jgi:hypothetical protein